ncbi:MAG: chromosome segregation protein SMC [Acidobacteria bacterium]|nr:chromosome segregation protein SMC [Acidobacteriota bacterium]
MYKLKRVELLGFKSFADRTRLDFTDGIAAVVGPNGCGKSNLSDAISWVLGEQSAKSLRGERMMDVIFNGTSARPATGMAEVSLTLIDPEYTQALPELPEVESTSEPNLEFPDAGSNGNGNGNGNGTGQAAVESRIKHRAGEIIVTRRLFRSGESEYLTNGETCRLRDIQDLFMGTGLGPESYAIIEQGRIGQILSSKPSDRRSILEEAAGVSKFKTRKRLAEAKLETSRQNLARIADILEEVTKQVNSLKRQASKARRFREMQEELRGRLKVTLTSRLRTLETECQRLRDEVAALAAATTEAAGQLEQIDRGQKTAAARYDELEAMLYELRTSIAQQEIDRERLAARIEQVRQQSIGLEARSGEAFGEIQALSAQLEALDAELTATNLQAAQLEQEKSAAQQAHGALAARQEELTAQIAQGEAAAEAGRQELLASVSQLAELRNQLVQAAEVGLALERQATRSQADISVVQQLHGRLTVELEALQSEYERDKSTLTSLEESVKDTTQSLEQARGEETIRRAAVDTLRQEFSSAQARKNALEESLARHSYSTESVRRLLAGGGNGNGFHSKGVLADFIEVSPGYEEVVEEYLKAELDYLVVERHEEAHSGIAMLKSEGSGRSTFLVTRAAGIGHGNGHQDGEVRQQAGVLASLRDLVRFEPELGLNGDLPFPALAAAYIVEDATVGERLAATYPQYHFLTASGEHYHHRLVTGGKGKSTGPLALRRDFRDLERRVVDLESRLRAEESALQDVSALVTRLDDELRKLTVIKVDAEKQTVVSDQKLQQIREAHERASERLRVLRDEAAMVEADRDSNQESQTSLRTKLEAAATERREREESVTRIANEVRDLRAQLDRLSPELLEAQTRLAGLEERTRSFEAELARIAARGDEIRARIAQLTAQTQGWSQELQRLAEESAGTALRLAELETVQVAGRETLQTLEKESQIVRARRDELAPTIEAARAELEVRREKKSGTEIVLARAQSDHAHHLEQCRQKLHTDPRALLAEFPAEQVLTAEALALAEAEVLEIETKIENLGPVNMMALEELQEAEERYTFLETQRQDLLASIEDTAQAIREIDQVSRQQFLEAFKAINGHFAEAFRTLFGGGIGEMRLSDESDADSGIDIVAQPPGKRLQNVLLLSGGEKALAALALLISMFRYTPSPFCILDEVDAPLDESNVRRFTNLIEQMSRHTQFILITHNKRTMEIAQVMYGVTMEEAGVSRLVSVRFDEAEYETEKVAVLA